MKRVISNKVYDTKTAKVAGRSDNKYSPTDFNYVEETLYRKKTGEFFIHGCGGARSEYGEWIGNSGRSGEKIKPLSEEQAKQWAEDNLDGDSYIKIFGDPESNTRSAMSISLPSHLQDKIRKESEKTGKSISSIVEMAIEEWLNGNR